MDNTEQQGHWVIEKLTEPFEEEVTLEKEIIEANKDLLLELLPVKDISEVNLFQLENFVLSDHEGIEAKKELKVFCMFLMVKILRAKGALKDDGKDFVHNLYLLGAWRERLQIALSDLEHFDEVTNWRHSMKAKSSLDMRYVLRREQYAEAMTTAESMWKKGSPRILPQMVNHLIQKYPALSRRTLHKELLPMAVQYSKTYVPNAPRTRNSDRKKAVSLQNPPKDNGKGAVFTISHYCEGCNHIEPMLSVKVGTPSQLAQLKPQMKCPQCGRLCQYLTQWPDGETNIDSYGDAQESIDAYNAEFLSKK